MVVLIRVITDGATLSETSFWYLLGLALGLISYSDRTCNGGLASYCDSIDLLFVYFKQCLCVQERMQSHETHRLVLILVR